MPDKSKLQDAHRAIAKALLAVNEHEAEDNKRPFQRIDLESGYLRIAHREASPTEVETLEYYIEQGCAFYEEGDINTAILWAYYAGLYTAKLVKSNALPFADTQGAAARLMELAEHHLPAGKVLRKKVQTTRQGDKAIFDAQWGRCFQSVADFRNWKAAKQRDYIAEHHPDKCGKLKKDTMRSYCKKLANAATGVKKQRITTS